MSTAEEFILIPKNQYMKVQPNSSQILNDPRVQHRGAQFSFLNRMRPNENTNKEYQEILDTRETIEPTELSKVKADKILQNLKVLAPAKFTRTEKIVSLIKGSKKVVLDENENFIVDGTATGINVPIFLYDLQQPTKKLINPDFFKILEVLNIKEDLVINRNAKIAIRKRTQRTAKQKKIKGKLFRQKESSTKKPVNYLQKNPQTPEVVSKLRRKTELSKRRRTGSLSTNEKKLLELKYTQGPAAYGSVKNPQRIANLEPSKVKLFLEGKKAHTKHKKHRKKFPTLKVIAYDVNEIWSLDLAHVDKLAKENKDVKYLLVAVDCLSRYLRVEP